jgi:hypothetical protein
VYHLGAARRGYRSSKPRAPRDWVWHSHPLGQVNGRNAVYFDAILNRFALCSSPCRGYDDHLVVTGEPGRQLLRHNL